MIRFLIAVNFCLFFFAG